MLKNLGKTNRPLHRREDHREDHRDDGYREGPHDRLTDATSGLQGDCTFIYGDATGLYGDVDSCLLSDEERTVGVDISELLQ